MLVKLGYNVDDDYVNGVLEHFGEVVHKIDPETGNQLRAVLPERFPDLWKHVNGDERSTQAQTEPGPSRGSPKPEKEVDSKKRQNKKFRVVQPVRHRIKGAPPKSAIMATKRDEPGSVLNRAG